MASNTSDFPWTCIDAELIIDKQLWICPTNNGLNCTPATEPIILPIGTFIQYHIKITNPGPEPIYSYVITDDIPA